MPRFMLEGPRAHTQCMSYVTKTLLLVSSSVRSKQLLCFVHGQGQKRKGQKPTTKNFVEFHNHSPLLTMVTCNLSKLFSYLNSIQCSVVFEVTRLYRVSNHF